MSLSYLRVINTANSSNYSDDNRLTHHKKISANNASIKHMSRKIDDNLHTIIFSRDIQTSFWWICD